MNDQWGEAIRGILDKPFAERVTTLWRIPLTLANAILLEGDVEYVQPLETETKGIHAVGVIGCRPAAHYQRRRN